MLTFLSKVHVQPSSNYSLVEIGIARPARAVFPSDVFLHGRLVCRVIGGASACFLLAVSSFIGRVVLLKIVSRTFLFGGRLVVFGRDVILPVVYVRIFD